MAENRVTAEPDLPSDRPSSPRPWLPVIAGLAAGVGLGMGLWVTLPVPVAVTDLQSELSRLNQLASGDVCVLVPGTKL